VLTSALTVLLCLLGVAGMRGGGAVRVAADLAGLGVLAVYLGSPGLFARAGLGGVAGVAVAGAVGVSGIGALAGRAEAITDREEA
jgi:hypothetical protein